MVSFVALELLQRSRYGPTLSAFAVLQNALSSVMQEANDALSKTADSDTVCRRCTKSSNC